MGTSRMDRKEQRRLNDLYHLARGKCTRCGVNPVIPGMKVCEACREKNNRQRRERRAALRAMGRCSECGGQKQDDKYLTCENCRSRNREARGKKKAESRKKWYDTRRENGECVCCGGWAEPGKARCAACQKKSSESARKSDPGGEKRKQMRQQRIENGLCIDCGRPVTDGRKRCPRCLEMRNDSTRKYQIHKRIMAQNEKERMRLIGEGKKLWAK